jgi:hypothetical protein
MESVAIESVGAAALGSMLPSSEAAGSVPVPVAVESAVASAMSAGVSSALLFPELQEITVVTAAIRRSPPKPYVLFMSQSFGFK